MCSCIAIICLWFLLFYGLAVYHVNPGKPGKTGTLMAMPVCMAIGHSCFSCSQNLFKTKKLIIIIFNKIFKSESLIHPLKF